MCSKTDTQQTKPLSITLKNSLETYSKTEHTNIIFKLEEHKIRPEETQKTLDEKIQKAVMF